VSGQLQTSVEVPSGIKPDTNWIGSWVGPELF